MSALLEKTGHAFVDPQFLMAAYSVERGVPTEMLTRPWPVASQTRRITTLRHELIWLMRQMTDLSFAQIGAMMNRDYATVYHAHGAIADRIARDPDYRGSILDLLTRLFQVIHARDPQQPYVGVVRHAD